MIKDYDDLSRNEHRAAKKLAKELLRSVPSATDIVEGDDIDIKPENVEAVLIYDDGKGHWGGDIIIREGPRTLRWTTYFALPLRSYDEALNAVKIKISWIKSNPEEDEIDDEDDVEQGLMLKISYPDLGWRWMCFDSDDEVAELAEAFGSAFGDSKLAFDKARVILLKVGKPFYSLGSIPRPVAPERVACARTYCGRV